LRDMAILVGRYPERGLNVRSVGEFRRGHEPISKPCAHQQIILC
jgi:hypothetical protein